MEKLDITGLLPAVADKIRPMFDEVIAGHAKNIHSIHVIGSAVIPDYNEKRSDINSVIVLRIMELGFIEFLAPLGKKYGKKQLAAPLVLTPEYIGTSLDAFPIEFFDFRLIHSTIYGEDILKGLHIDRHSLRLQCEREIKTKLIQIRQGYLSSLGKKDDLQTVLVRSVTGSMALFRAIISLLGKEPPIPRASVVSAFGATTGIGTAVFEKMLMLKAGAIKPPEQELRVLFEQYHLALEATGKIINELPA